MILFIKNNVTYHYEIIEYIIVNYHKILKIKDDSITIFLLIVNNVSYMEYIKQKYPHIHLTIPKQFNYYISCTIYDRHYPNLIKNSNKIFYIAHEVTDRLQQLTNVYFLTPLANKYIIANKLPYSENKIKSTIPIYIVQGNITSSRRYYKLLTTILDANYSWEFKIKLVGYGNLPEELDAYSNKIIVRNNLNFIDYHREFLDAYCILPLITKQTHPQYYTNKLTSSINYCTGYNLKCILDTELQQIYNLNNVEVFNNENDIAQTFNKTLIDFYKNA